MISDFFLPERRLKINTAGQNWQPITHLMARISSEKQITSYDLVKKKAFR